MKTKKRFRSRISVLLLGFVLAVFIPCAILMPIPGLYTMGGTFIFLVFLLSGIRYTIFEDNLYVKGWIIPFGIVKISDIISIERSYCLLSSPALSLKRLRLDIRKTRTFPYMWMLISPVREQEFINELKAINPDIQVHVPDKKGMWRVQDWDI